MKPPESLLNALPQTGVASQGGLFIVHKVSPEGGSACGRVQRFRGIRPRLVDGVCGVCWPRFAWWPKHLLDAFPWGKEWAQVTFYLRGGRAVLYWLPEPPGVGGLHELALVPLPMGNTEVKELLRRYWRKTGDLNGLYLLYRSHVDWRSANGMDFLPPAVVQEVVSER